jgi:putative endonuclease
MSGQASRLLGRWGEGLAADHLRKKGYSILAANWRCRFGEIDLIAANRHYLCFVEVKLRKSAAFGQAGEFVDQRKQMRLRTTAELYLAQNPTALQPRFDVVEIEAPQGMDTKEVIVRHMENAF